MTSCIERQRTAFWRVHRGSLYQGVSRDLFGRTTNATYANMAGLSGEPAAALFQATEATSSDTWPWAKVACMEVKASSEDICEVQLKVAADDTVQLEVIPVPCLDVHKCTFCTYGGSRTTQELSDMAASAVSLKSVLPSLSSSALRKMLLQMRIIQSGIIFCQCTVHKSVEEMIKSTISQLQTEVRQHRYCSESAQH